MPVTKKRTRRRRVRRTTALSGLDPHVRQAFQQELLDQGALFRQISAASNGVPGPIQRNVIPDLEEIEELDSQVYAQPELPPEPPPEPVAGPPGEKGEPGDKGEPGEPGITQEQAGELLEHDKKRFKKLITGGAAGILVSMLLGAGALKWFYPPASGPATPDVASPTEVVETDAQLLEVLSRDGYTIPSTDLSETVNHVYNYDPELRDRHLRELQQTFDEDP